MGEHADPETTPAAFWVWFWTKAKAFTAAGASAVLSFLGILLLDPSTTAQVGGILPDQYKWLAPVLIGILTGFVTHKVPNKKV